MACKIESSAATLHLETALEETHKPTHSIIGSAHLFQEDSNGRAAMLLLPHPVDDPKDPLTWNNRRKRLILSTASLFVFLSNYITATITPIYIPIIEHFNVSTAKASYLITFNILFLGIGNLFWVPLSLKIGKRPVLILSSAIFFASSVWATVAHSWGSLFCARIVQGFGASSSEALGPSIIADLYFLHERGSKMGFYSFMIASGSALGGIFSGLVAQSTHNWRWVFGMNAILTGRPREYENGEGMEPSRLAAIRAQANLTWLQSLRLTSWYDRNTTIWQLWWSPFLTLRYPAVVWCSLAYGVSLGWVVLQQTANASAFPEIYGFNELAVGNINIANLVGAIIGCLAGGPLTDYVVSRNTKRHQGYFKPEFRLWCLIPAIIFGPVGLLLWGGGLGSHLPAMVAIIGGGITYAVLCLVPAIGMTYVVDCYRPLASETMTILTAFKNTFAFGLSFAVTPWLKRDRYMKVAGWCVLIEGFIFLITIPIYMYGERLRN